MTTEVQDVITNGVVTARRVTYIDPQSRRFQADIPVPQADTDAVQAVAAALYAQSPGGGGSAAPITTAFTDQQTITPAQVQAVIAPDVSDGSVPIDPQED